MQLKKNLIKQTKKKENATSSLDQALFLHIQALVLPLNTVAAFCTLVTNANHNKGERPVSFGNNIISTNLTSPNP